MPDSADGIRLFARKVPEYVKGLTLITRSELKEGVLYGVIPHWQGLKYFILPYRRTDGMLDLGDVPTTLLDDVHTRFVECPPIVSMANAERWLEKPTPKEAFDFYCEQKSGELKIQFDRPIAKTKTEIEREKIYRKKY